MLTYPELRNLIALSRADETCELFDEAVAVFDKYSVPGYMDVFDATLGNHPDVGDEDMVTYLVEDAKLIAENLLNIQGIQLNEGVPLSGIVMLANATFDMTNYEDKDLLDRILGLDESPIEIYGQLVELVSGLRVIGVMEMVNSVSSAFVPTFRELLTQSKEPEETDEVMPKILAAYTQWKVNCQQGAPLYADKYLQQNTTIGLPFEVYLHLYQVDTHFSATTDLQQLQQVAKDIFGLALLSQDGFNNPLMTIRSKLSVLFPDVDSSTKVDLEINKLLTEYSRK